MRRRLFIALAAGAPLGWPLAAGAQQAGRVYRICVLGNVPVGDSQGARVWAAFTQGLRDLGYVEGQNLLMEHRSTEGRSESLPALIEELVQLSPDVIVVPNQANAVAVRKVTQTIPIVAANFDPLGSGLAASYARPGGNVTGLLLIAPELVGKQLELLKEIVPRLKRVAILWSPINRSSLPLLEEANRAANVLGLWLLAVEARDAWDLERAFASMSREQVDALLVFGDAMFILQRKRIADLAERNHLPAMYVLREYLDAGGLVFYGPSMADNFRRAAAYVDKILRGAKPGDLPVEQPTKFELVINLKTARRLGLDIPASILARADEVIE